MPHPLPPHVIEAMAAQALAELVETPEHFAGRVAEILHPMRYDAKRKRLWRLAELLGLAYDEAVRAKDPSAIAGHGGGEEADKPKPDQERPR